MLVRVKHLFLLQSLIDQTRLGPKLGLLQLSQGELEQLSYLTWWLFSYEPADLQFFALRCLMVHQDETYYRHYHHRAFYLDHHEMPWNGHRLKIQPDHKTFDVHTYLERSVHELDHPRGLLVFSFPTVLVGLRKLHLPLHCRHFP